VSKPVQDRKELTVEIFRYRCEKCKRTFRKYPEDLDRSNHARGIRRFAALLWALGLSYREIKTLLEKNQIRLSRSTIWREGQIMTSQIAGKRVRKFQTDFWIDPAYIPNISNQFGLVLVVDFSNGKYLVIGTLNEHNPISVKSWLNPLIQGTNIEIAQFGTDTLNHIPLVN
jgi:hypothetical protein